VLRSLITAESADLRTTGGIVAAPTTRCRRSWGREKLGSRFCWLRDATFTLLALMNSGYTEEASAWHHWLLRAVAGSPANHAESYGIMASGGSLEWKRAGCRLRKAAQPVRIGTRRRTPAAT